MSAFARRRRLRSAVLLGSAIGLRTFSAPAALALRTRPLSGPRRLVVLAAAGEMIADKLKAMPSRLVRRGLRGRLISSAFVGFAVAGPVGAVTGSGAAFAGAVSGNRARRRFAGMLAAVVEDCVAITLGVLGARSLPERAHYPFSSPYRS